MAIDFLHLRRPLPQLARRALGAALAALAILGAALLAPAPAQAQATGEQVLPLKRVGTMKDKVQMLGSAVVGNRLYYFGGNSDQRGWLNECFSAEIANDGMLGAWRQELPLPEMRNYLENAVQVVNDRIYICSGNIARTAGSDDDNPVATTVLWSRVKADGTLEAWKNSVPFSARPGSFAATASNDKHLYIIGGKEKVANQQNVLSGITMCDLADDGSPTNWRAIDPLPFGLWYHGASIQGERLYVWGGLPARGPETVNNKVISAPIKPDGTLGQWRQDTEVQNPTYSSVFSGFNEHLLNIGGRYINGYPTPIVQFARLQGDVAAPWRSMKTDLEARVYHSLALDSSRGWVFIVGGRFRPGLDINVGGCVDVVQAFQVTQPKSARVTDGASAGASAAAGLQSFPPLESVLGKSQKPLLVFFYSPEVPASKVVYDTIFRSREFGAIAQNYTLAGVDVSGEGRKFSYQYGVFKVPSIALLQPDGTLIKSASIRTLADLQKLMQP